MLWILFSIRCINHLAWAVKYDDEDDDDDNDENVIDEYIWVKN